MEFEEEEENIAPIDIDDDENYGNTDLICEEQVVEEDYDFCSNFDENPIAHFVQPCGHFVCTTCVKKNKIYL